MKQVHIIDLDNVIHTSKAGKFVQFNYRGFPNGGVYRVFQLMNNIGVFKDPEVKVIFVSDTKHNTRKELAPLEYKRHRSNKTNKQLVLDKAMRLQKEYLSEVLTDAGFTVLSKDGFEADDIMFNIVKHYAWKEGYPLANNQMMIMLHTSDLDWCGAMGLANNVFMKSTAGNSPVAKITDFNDHTVVQKYTPYEVYLQRACFGDNDGYAGFNAIYRNVYADTIGSALDFSMDYIASNNIEIHQVFSNMDWWKQVYTLAFQGNDALIGRAVEQVELAFPYDMPDIFGMDFDRLLDKPINKQVIQDMLSLFRIKIFERDPSFGMVDEADDALREKMSFLKNRYSSEYNDVFTLYKEFEYVEEQPIEVLSVETHDRIANMVAKEMVLRGKEYHKTL